MHSVDFGAGTHIEAAAKMLVAAATQHGSARGLFNDIEITADASTKPEDVLARWDAQHAARAEAYRNSPAGKKAAQEAEDRRAVAQSSYDAAAAQLHEIDWSSDVAVLDWLCAVQPATDLVGVEIDRDLIVGVFEGRGFKANTNCGPDYKADDRDNAFRYLVGQALSGLKDGPAIHPILLKFAGEWKAKFDVNSRS